MTGVQTCALPISPQQFSKIVSKAEPSTLQLDGTLSETALITPIEIHSWLSRAWLTGSEYLSLKDQVTSLATITTICGLIGLERKHSFYLRQTGLASHALLQKKDYDTLTCNLPSLKCIYKAYEVMVQTFKFRLNEPWMETYGDGVAKRIPFLIYGWHSLQVNILRECIEIAESNLDYVSTVTFTSLLLGLYKSLSKKEQNEYAEILQRVAVYSKPKKNVEHFAKYLTVKSLSDRILGIPILRMMKPVAPQDAFMTTKVHPLESQTRKVFLYNPYAKDATNKSTEEKVVVGVGDVWYVDVTLANPFLFDLDIQKLSLV